MLFSDIKKKLVNANIFGKLKKKKIKFITDHSDHVNSNTLLVINNNKKLMVIVSQLAFYGQTYQNKKWKDMLNHEYSYCLSCLSPLFMAFGVFLRINTLVATCSWFPWYLFVLTLTTQALVTYKGDVTTFGYASWWKMCDVWFALLHSICFAAFVIFPITYGL